MDKTVLESQKLLGTYTHCSQDPTLWRNYHLLLGGNCKQRIKNKPFDLRNPANLGISLLDKTPVKELLADNDCKNVKQLNYKQLSLSLI
jgi:hypothetical protein